MTGPKTPEALLEKLSAATKRILSDQEIREQRISFIMGAVDEDSTITRDQIQKVIQKLEGEPAV